MISAGELVNLKPEELEKLVPEERKKLVVLLICQLRAEELMDVVKVIQNKFGISANSYTQTSGAAAAVNTADAGPAEEEKTEFSVFLTGFGIQKINVIRTIRDIVKLTLGDAKAAVEGTANAAYEVASGLSKEQAEALKKKLEEAGGSGELR